MTPREKIATWPSNRANRFNFASEETLSAARTITLAEIEKYQGFAFDPGGSARTITLPAEEQCDGVVILVANTANAAEILTINDDGAAAVCTPTQNESAILWCDGSSWYGLVGDFA